MSGPIILMALHCATGIRYAPLVLLHFPFSPSHSLAAERFRAFYFDDSLLTFTAEKLRYYRYQKSLLQRQVAAWAGIPKSTYLHYENPSHERYPLDKLRRIAALLEVDIELLLDDYNRFLMNQGEQVRNMRERLGLSQQEFGKRLGVQAGTVRKWESGRVRMRKETWEMLLRII
ncbi:helix-turn-helix domain-containing protein [Solibaculum intestinale]|uniref:Helix-turn-helix domain-containing protein n=1 Tax=Solibaculum intestinale TaxID=3133165 RepID=A0ABV1E0I9_9FIRM